MKRTGTIKQKGKEAVSMGRFQPANNRYFLKKEGPAEKIKRQRENK